MLKLQPALKAYARPALWPPQIRRSSTVDFSKLESDLRSRQLPLLYTELTPQPSYLLDQTLRDFLASSTLPNPTRQGLQSETYPLPPGHHLVYFPTPTTASQLLPDGTDTLHSPGPPFTKRLWAGGRILFQPPADIILTARRLAVLVECIRDVRVTGKAGSEKVFVRIERRISEWVRGKEDESATRRRVLKDSEEDMSEALLVERRDLCFLRDDIPSSFESSTSRKVLAPPVDPSYTFTLTPTQALLFRFSALTFNAHAIHIDPEYTRDVYGLPKLLVHGPLCITLMLECLSRARWAYDIEVGRARSMIKEISYRNFKPIFVGEEMRVCGKRKGPKQAKKDEFLEEEWEVWIETGEGDARTLAVRGTAKVAPVHQTKMAAWNAWRRLRRPLFLGQEQRRALSESGPEAESSKL